MVLKTGKEKRESFPYRRKYLEHNKGIFGIWYICCHCLKPRMRNQIDVDHIVPNAKWYSVNRTFNCVASCASCNRSRGQKMGTYFVKAVVGKVFEEIFILIQNIILLILRGLVVGVLYALRFLLSGFYSKSPMRFIYSGGLFFLIYKVFI